MRPTELLASALLLFASATSAWPSGWEGFQADVAPLFRRQDLVERQDQSSRTSFNLDFTGVQGNTASLTQSDTTQTGKSGSQITGTGQSDATGTGTSTGKQTDGGNTTGKSGTQTGSSEPTKTYDARLPAGGVSMITPNPMTTQYYKIADYVTFAWNYTSLSATPSYVDVLASCSLNQETYTIAQNLSVQETQTVVWDTGKYQSTATIPLLTQTYTLIIHDAAKDVSALPSAGYLGTYNQFTFGMYTPQPYTPIANWVCATCNSAMTVLDKQTMYAVFAMAGVTVLSFGWFTGVAGLW